MSKLHLLLAFGLIGCVLVLLTGCDSASTDPKLQTGDVNDPEFQQIDALFGSGFTDMSGTMLDLTFNLIDSIPVPAEVRKPTAFAASEDFDNLEFSYSYNAETYWHVFTVSASALQDDGNGDTTTFTFSGSDSVRFATAEGYTQYPDESITGAAVRWHFDADVTAPDGDFSFDSDASIDLTGEYQGNFTLNGTSSDAVSLAVTDGDATCALDISASQLYSDVYVPSSDQGESCPTSGRIDVAASIDLQCEGQTPDGYDELSINGDWVIAYIFNDGTITVVYSDGTTQWTTTDQCGSEVTYSPHLPVVQQ